VGKVVIPRDILFKVYKDKGPSAMNMLSWIFINANFDTATSPIVVDGSEYFLKKGELFTTLKELAEIAQKTSRHVQRYVHYYVHIDVLSVSTFKSKGLLIKINNYSALVDFNGSDVSSMSTIMSDECQNDVSDMSTIKTKVNKGKQKKNNNTLIPLSEIEEVYQAYPLKKGKKMGQAKLQRMIRDGLITKEKALTAVEAFVAECEAEGTETKYMPHWSTFVNQRIEDYADAAQKRQSEYDYVYSVLKAWNSGDKEYLESKGFRYGD
jgi:hypothetical protein